MSDRYPVPHYAETVLFIATGGTIDSKAVDDPEHPPVIREMYPDSLIPELLEYINEERRAKGVAPIEYEVKEWGQRADSSDFNEQYMARIANFMVKEYEQGRRHFVITHGTYHMPRNMEMLWDIIDGKMPEASIIATGASISFDQQRLPEDDPRYRKSDGPTNLQHAYSMVKVMKPGIKILDQGNLYNPAHIEKDIERQCFVLKAEFQGKVKAK